MNRSLLPLSVACILAVSSRPALAQGVLAEAPAAPLTAPPPAGPAATPPPLTDLLMGAAKEAYAAAQVLVNNGDFQGAYAKFSQAYDVSKDPRLLFNMAVAARNFHDYARMQSLLLRYEREAGPSMSASDSTEVDNALATIRTLVGALKITVDAAGSTVSVDGESIGSTPLTGPVALNLGKHTLAIKKQGFQPVERVVDVAGGGETTVDIVMVAQRHFAQLTVAADSEATVILDGQAAAHGRFDGQVVPGIHEIRVAEGGKLPYEAQVDLRDGETRSLDVTLENERHAAVWPWVVGGLLVAAGAAVGGYFLLVKPSEQTTPVPAGQTAALQLSAWR